MLVLSRRENESVNIIVDGKVLGTVTVVHARYNKRRGGRGVRLGFDFPKEVLIVRDDAKNTDAKED
jgi:sRNA-binding carbon storage regulator CsrA